MISDEKFRVATISDGAIPENAIVHKLDLIAVILMPLFAVLTFQTRGS